MSYDPLNLFLESAETQVSGILSTHPTPNNPTSNRLTYGSNTNDNIREEPYRLSKSSSSVFSFMTVFTSVYLITEALQCSTTIKSNDHNTITQNAYAYNLLFVWLVTYFFLHFSDIISKKKPNILLYWIFCCLGGVGFALLGEVPFLKNIVIVTGWWNHISIQAWFVLVFFVFIISFLCLKECFYNIRNLIWCRNIVKILSVFFLYFLLLILLINGKSKNIIYHIHHAIFAGILSLWFVNWNYKPAMFMHAILMGIVIEGINFYGIGEFFLFIVGNSPITFNITLLISLVFLIPLAIIMKYIY